VLKTTLFVLLLGLPLLSWAESPDIGVIYKCADSKQRVSYQNAPCESGQKQVRQLPYVHVGPDTRVTERNAAIQREMDQRNRSARSTGLTTYSFGQPGPIRPEVARCRAAKEDRERILNAAGLKRTFDLLSRLDTTVWEACKHVPGV
jgi:hypothetical protein